MIKAIIFDCFGVLITDVLEGLVAKFRTSDPDRAARIVAIVTAASKGEIPHEESRPLVAAELGISPEAYAHRIRDEETKNDALLGYIKRLRTQEYKTAMLSNVSSKGLDARFTSEEQSQYFNVVVASGVIGYAKPEAKAYEITADKLGVRTDECVMVDDREDYCEGARAVGMQTVLYISFDDCKAKLEAQLNT